MSERSLSPKLLAYNERRRLEVEERFLKTLKSHDGIATPRQVRIHAYLRLSILRKYGCCRITFSLKRGSGTYTRFQQLEVFKAEYLGKTFICRDRTALVRLMHKAVKLPKNPHRRRTLIAFLRRYLTEAEKLAVLWHLGYELENMSKFKLRQVVKSQAIQLNGFYKPKRATLEASNS